MKDVVVIDQAVPTSTQNMLENIALGESINWFRYPGATYTPGVGQKFPVTPDSVDTQQFSHLVFENTQGTEPRGSQFFPLLLPVITAIPYTIKQMIRIKMNLCVPAFLDNPNAYGMPHVDFTEVKEPLLTAIYYVNDSTGDTLIFDQRFGEKGPLTIKTRVEPKKGRLVVFDGKLLHSGNTPRTNTPRINVNFNAFVYEGAITQP